MAETLHLVLHSEDASREANGSHKNSIVVPALIIGSVNAKNLWDEHWEHWEHMPPLEERVQYPYMNIRTKAYPWGDGDKVGFLFPVAETMLTSTASSQTLL